MTEAPRTKADLIDEDPKLRALKKQPITVSQAANEYAVPRNTILAWKNYGYIAVLDEGTGRAGSRLTLDRADVAVCVKVYGQRKKEGFGFGNAPLFNPDGTLYEIKHPDLAKRRRARRQRQKKRSYDQASS